MEKQIEFRVWGEEEVVIVTVYDNEEILDYREYAWPDMQLLRTTSYGFNGKENVRQGEEVVYDKDGVRRYLFNYINDVLDGEQIEYEEGFPVVRLYYKRGKVYLIEKYDYWNFITERIVYGEGDDLEKHTWFYPGTEIVAKEEGTRKSDWYSEGYYKWSRLCPLYREKVAIPFGFLKNIEQIVNRKSNSYYKYSSRWTNGFLEGNYQVYNGSGYFLLTFKDGLIDGVVKEYGGNRTLLSATGYKGGLRHGKSYRYNPDGSVNRTEEYRNGKLLTKDIIKK